MSFKSSALLLGSRGKGYFNRVPMYPYRRQKAYYKAPRKPHRNSPLVNKPPEEYGNTWDLRCGIEWYYRMHKRNHYRHWPWARWTDDPIRLHEDMTQRRTLSAMSVVANEGVPAWDYYKEVGQAYDTPSHFPFVYVVPFIHQYTGKIWSRRELESYVLRIQSEPGLGTIADVAANLPALHAWGQRHLDDVPRGVLLHVELVARDVVAENAKKAFRKAQHESGVLRTREMVRYYALPHLTGPAMPTSLAQPSGAYPYGRYTHMLDTVTTHPEQRVDGWCKDNMYPA